MIIKGDRILFLTMFALMIFGIFMIHSASSYTASMQMGDAFYYSKRQLITMLIGIVLYFLIVEIDERYILKTAKWQYMISVVLLLTVFFVGTASHGQKRWIYVGPIGFQPSEYAKFVLIIFIAAMSQKSNIKMNHWRGILKVFLMILPVVVLVMISNLSTGIIILAISACMIFTTSKAYKPFVFIAVIGLVMSIVFLNVASYRIDRIDAWLNVESHPKGYQTRQSLYAIGSGGLFGKGYGKSIQKLAYVPEAHNDMIFSIICEEWGLTGAMIVIILFGIIIWRMMHIAIWNKRLENALIVIGVLAHLSIQMLINIAVVTNTIPNTGIPLPFVSYGGTSLIFILCEMGMVQKIAHSLNEDIYY